MSLAKPKPNRVVLAGECDKHFHPAPNQSYKLKPDEEWEYYEEDVLVDPEKTSFDLEEEEYIEFLKQYGHVDFSLLQFQPDLRTIAQYEELYQEEFIRLPRMQRSFNMVGNKFDFDKLRAHGHMLIQIKPKKEMKKDSKAEQRKLMEA